MTTKQALHHVNHARYVTARRYEDIHIRNIFLAISTIIAVIWGLCETLR